MQKRSEANRSAAVSQLLKVTLATFAIGAVSLTAQAAPVSLSDLNSTITIDPLSPAGLSSWTVDGQNQLAQQWFWYRIGSNPEAAINTISPANVSTYGGTRGVTTTYGNALFTIEINHFLTGGTAGSGKSDLVQDVRIINNTGSTLDFHFFTYADFDLNGTPGGDSVLLNTIAGKYYVTDQTDGSTAFIETVNTPPGIHGEAAGPGVILTKLNNGVADNLSDITSAGPGDVTWALQWNFSIAAGDTALLTLPTHIQIALIPEPSVAALVGLGLAGLLVRRNRRS